MHLHTHTFQARYTKFQKSETNNT